MKHLRKLLITLLLLASPLCLMAQQAAVPTSLDVRTGLYAFVDASMSSVAAYLSSPQLNLPGCEISSPSGDGLPSQIIFTQSDISTYLPVLRPQDTGMGWLGKLLAKVNVGGLLSETAASLLEANGWKRGDIILDGNMDLSFPEGTSVASLMGLMINARPGVAVATVVVDMALAGAKLSAPMHLEGEFTLEVPQTATLVITPVRLLANGYAVEGGKIRIGT